MGVANLGYHTEYVENTYKEQQLRITKLEELIRAKEEEIKKLEGITGYQDNKDWQQAQIELQKYKNELSEVGNKYFLVKNQAADMFDQLIVQGESFKSIWNNLWKQLASEAIKRLFQVKSEGSLLGNLLGLFGGSKGSGNSSGGNLFSYTNLWTPLVGHADGGIFDQEHITRINEGNKKEAVIPMENASRGVPLWIETGKQMGLIGNSSGISPNLKYPDLASKSNIQIQRDTEHISKLEEANQFMRTQNQILIEMLNNGGNNNTVTQPIVMSTQMSDDELYNKINRMKSNGYKF
jgi:hypothetical protein